MAKPLPEKLNPAWAAAVKHMLATPPPHKEGGQEEATEGRTEGEATLPLLGDHPKAIKKWPVYGCQVVLEVRTFYPIVI